MKLNLITLALASLSFGAHAFDFGVTNANTDAVNQDKWSCKRCVSEAQLIGTVGVEAGAAIQNDDHAANSTGYEDGFAGAVNADLLKVHDNGMRSKLVVDQLGNSKQGSAQLSAMQAGKWNAEISYNQLHTVDSLNGQSLIATAGNQATLLDDPQAVELVKDRDVIAFGAEAKMGMVSAFVDVDHTIRDGARRSSLTDGDYQAINYAQAIDDTTTNFNAGARVAGSNWGLTGGYQGSFYSNSADGMSYTAFDASADPQSQSAAVDSQAYNAYVKGFYRIDKTHFSGRIAAGEMTQDAEVVAWSSPAQSPETAVETIDANLRMTSRISPRIRLNASADYSQRDNTTDYSDLNAITIDPVTGQASNYTGHDVDRQRYKVAADYRVVSGLRLTAGFDYDITERTSGEREETNETDYWGKVTWTAPAMFDVRIKAGIATRDGSTYMAEEADNLMRKYHLADRTRTYVKGGISHYPMANLSVDLDGHYAFDDYDNSSVGLIESEDYGVDGSISYRFNKDLNVNLFGGYQWISNLQYGDSWGAVNDDEFGYVGTGAQYVLSDLGLSFDLDYTLGYSQSWTDTSSQSDLGNYRQYSHSVELAANYQLTKAMVVGVSYQYERFFETDYSNIPTVNYPGDAVYGLNTLGLLDNNYNAHLVMLNFSYAL